MQVPKIHSTRLCNNLNFDHPRVKGPFHRPCHNCWSPCTSHFWLVSCNPAGVGGLGVALSRGNWCLELTSDFLIHATICLLPHHSLSMVLQVGYGAGLPHLVSLGSHGYPPVELGCLLGCSGLEQDASHFRHRRDVRFKTGDPSCKLCGAEVEDPEQFIASCPALEESRLLLLLTARCTVRDQLASHLSKRDLFVDTILGVVWVEIFRRFVWSSYWLWELSVGGC